MYPKFCSMKLNISNFDRIRARAEAKPLEVSENQTFVIKNVDIEDDRVVCNAKPEFVAGYWTDPSPSIRVQLECVEQGLNTTLFYATQGYEHHVDGAGNKAIIPIPEEYRVKPKQATQTHYVIQDGVRVVSQEQTDSCTSYLMALVSTIGLADALGQFVEENQELDDVALTNFLRQNAIGKSFISDVHVPSGWGTTAVNKDAIRSSVRETVPVDSEDLPY